MRKQSVSPSALHLQQSETSPGDKTAELSNPYNARPYPHDQHRDSLLANAEVASLGAATLAKMLRADELQASNHRDTPGEDIPPFNQNVRFGLHMALQTCLDVVEGFLEHCAEKAVKAGEQHG